jgi:hypothetical protein
MHFALSSLSKGEKKNDGSWELDQLEEQYSHKRREIKMLENGRYIYNKHVYVIKKIYIL